MSMMNNICEQETINKIVERINNLKNKSKALWGKMDVAQM